RSVRHPARIAVSFHRAFERRRRGVVRVIRPETAHLADRMLDVGRAGSRRLERRPIAADWIELQDGDIRINEQNRD
ncbi:MAG: hypothetical protein AAF961_06995, partial [Planctomycetota bacterium]